MTKEKQNKRKNIYHKLIKKWPSSIMITNNDRHQIAFFLVALKIEHVIFKSFLAVNLYDVLFN